MQTLVEFTMKVVERKDSGLGEDVLELDIGSGSGMRFDIFHFPTSV